MRGERFQYTLIVLGLAVAALFSVFLYRELYPEYKIYQNAYLALEKFRSSYTGKPIPPFKPGVKQIVLEKEDKGPADIDRCTSCHVALKFEHFSPTTIAYDINGNMERDADGFPVKIPNKTYIWSKLQEKIDTLRNPETNEKLKKEGKTAEVARRLEEADNYQALKTAHVGERCYDMTKVLRMHPLIGRETRPFEYHPIEEYGCTSCHSGNGRGLTTEKAHGPVFDGHYEEEFLGPTPQFLEKDPHNDPKFASVFNHKPGHSLLFQTTPILVGDLMEAKCMQCHKNSQAALEYTYESADVLAERKKAKSDAVIQSYNNELQAVASLITLWQLLKTAGYEKTMTQLEESAGNYKLPQDKREAYQTQLAFLRKNQNNKMQAKEKLKKRLLNAIGNERLLENLLKNTRDTKNLKENIGTFIQNKREEQGATGTLFAKADAANLERALIKHVNETESSLQNTLSDTQTINAIQSDIDLLTQNFHRGQQLYLSQACYACHRIAGFARGGVGPELTLEGHKYPWFIKESMVWPQADLKTSTMPNYKLDHEELEDLMTFLLAQTGKQKKDSETGYKIAIQNWEAGKKVAWEKPISPAQMHNLDYAMEVFATQGCAACHRLKGFESNVGFAVEKENPDFSALYTEREWFQELIPEEISGSTLVERIEKNKKEIDQRIIDNVREGALLETIEEKHPGSIEALYSPFKYALRAKNHQFEKENPETAEKEKMKWQERVRRVLMMYVQEYGLGRLIGPRPNWSGVYRSDQWLMEHFKNPQAHVARSIMPVFPFDKTKFYALTYMLDVLGYRNRNNVREIWKERGFNPELAYEIFCSQCHGEFLQGNGPVSEWIYPIPKNLRNADFLRNLTRERVYESIIHGIKGGPMPPWGEVANDKPMADGTPVITENEALQLVDWLYSSIPGSTIIRGSEDVPKWQYSPEDVIQELKNEGGSQKLSPQEKKRDTQPELTALNHDTSYYADREPKVYVSEKAPSQLNVENVFNIIPNPSGTTEKKAYYIKKKYYTAENLAAGKAFFELNCSVCHGRDADGAGNRAGSMVDAKPRMLTNLDWLDTRDDLRLLRSIKYGVAGTSMTPWGDQTSSLQRLQLVMYIRTISDEAKKRDSLFNTIYQTFNTSEQVIEEARIANYPKIAEASKELESTKDKRKKLERAVQTGDASANEAAEAYQKELQLANKLNKLEENDQALQALIDEIQNEKNAFTELGLTLITMKRDDISIKDYNKLVESAAERYHWNSSTNTINITGNVEVLDERAAALQEKIERAVKHLTTEKKQVQGQIKSPQREESIKNLNYRIQALKNLNNKLIETIEESKRSMKRQEIIIKERLNFTA